MDLGSLQGIALSVAEARSADEVLRGIVEGLVSRDGIALARVWLRERGDICPTCPMRSECADQTACLHLVASAGVSRSPGVDWSALGGTFRRFPLGARKIGHIGARREGILVPCVREDPRWIARPEWTTAEGIRSFAGQPLVFRGETLGVLGVFSREPVSEVEFTWLRTFADHAAIAIANSRAFAAIDRLREQLERENEFLHEELRLVQAFGEIVGQSHALAKALRQVELVAPTDASVLIQGESGTGKELVARAIHERSQRKDRPLVKVNCSAIPRELFESEFFGHVKGSFTGALKDRIGRFQLADGGTLFLDEIGEIPIELQSKLLRVLQEGEFERIGDDRTRSVDVRVIAATNRNLKEEADAKRFRADLYFRLSVFPIDIPPLRERREDIPPLLQHFAKLSGRRHGVEPPPITREQARTLQAYDWPGNIRELQHVVERAIITYRGGPLRFEVPQANRPREPVPPPSADTILTESEMRQLESQNLQRALEKTRWRVHGEGGAATILGIRPTTLLSRMKAIGLKKP